MDAENGNGKFGREQPENSRNSTRSASSIAREAAMREEIHARDVQIAQMRRAMRAAGIPLEGFETETEGDTFEEEAESTPEFIAPVNNVGGGAGGGNMRGSTFKTLMDCKPPTFKGGENALAC